jgi:hypothetical protein
MEFLMLLFTKRFDTGSSRAAGGSLPLLGSPSLVQQSFQRNRISLATEPVNRRPKSCPWSLDEHLQCQKSVNEAFIYEAEEM